MGLAARRPSPQEMAPKPIKLKKGQMLFAEGENSTSMYYVKSGMIRIFKKKGESSIEIDTIRSGQIIGELAFLDGNPRSASGEALTDCELVEVSTATFAQTMKFIPDWMKLMLKTIVGRLRTASTRIRQLEQASTAFDYSSKDGKRSAHYIYLSARDSMCIASAVLLVASRNGEKDKEGIEVRVGLLQRYANQVMGIPVAKITTFLDILAQIHVVSLGDEDGSGRVILKDIDFLEKAVQYMNEENLLEATKRHDISLKGFVIMTLIAKHLDRYTPDKDTGIAKVNVAKIMLAETEDGKEPFRIDDFPELHELGYCSPLEVRSDSEAITKIKPPGFMKAFRLQRLMKAIEAVNEQKSQRRR